MYPWYFAFYLWSLLAGPAPSPASYPVISGGSGYGQYVPSPVVWYTPPPVAPTPRLGYCVMITPTSGYCAN